MKNLGLNELRTAYLDFFESNGHTRLKSFSLVPESDPSLFLINAGMAPLKAYFLGEKKMTNNRATSSQRCVRTQDIDSVGKTDRHATFFEMLGNFSFGDYFKREAITWASRFLLDVVELEKSRLWISVYENDDEAFRIWTEEIGISPDHMMRLGKEDNFWELDQGPCGPCSEIHYDRGPAFGEGSCPADNSDRFMEIWNLVFTQFDRRPDGTYEPLANPNIDTGMGLERIALVCGNARNIFELKEFLPLRELIEKLSGKRYGDAPKSDESIRVIMDHAKAMTFLTLDGVVPSNEGRGYILRRLLRRAYRHGKLLGIEGEFLTAMVEQIIEVYKGEYDELISAKDRIFRVVVREEENFQKTIDQGLQMLEDIVARLRTQGEDVLSGADAFKLYDTFGFPLDLTKEILNEQGMVVDETAFNQHMLEQREQSRAKRSTGAGWNDNVELDLSSLEATEFRGYEVLSHDAQVKAIFADNARVDALSAGEEGLVVLCCTPFYGEGGGQIGDRGRLTADGVSADVLNTTKNADGIFFHTVKVEQGELKSGQQVHAEVCEQRRRDIARNHSATHLLHKALKEVLGEHVKQAGSYVDDRRLRFDFSHFEAMTAQQVQDVENRVNEAIFSAYPVTTAVKSVAEATADGAVGLFEDKYKDVVRVVSMGDYSKELCGGTHVANTAEISMLRIVSEQGVSSGVRRIEAITGRSVYSALKADHELIAEIGAELKTEPAGIMNRLADLKAERAELRRNLESFSAKMAQELAGDLMGDIVDVDGIRVLTKRVDAQSMDRMKALADTLKADLEHYVIVLAGENEGKVLLVASVDKALNARGIHAGQLIRLVAQATGGNGGGRPDFATAGGRDASKIDEALALVEGWVKDNLK